MRFVSFACLLVCLSACGGNSSTETGQHKSKPTHVARNDGAKVDQKANAETGKNQPKQHTAPVSKKEAKTPSKDHGKGAKQHVKPSQSAKVKHSDKKSKTIAVGDKVPEFEVTVGGKKWKLSDLRKNKKWSEDGTLVLTFWCSFCHSCRDVERPLDKLAGTYKGRVAIMAIDASYGETTEGVAKFAKKRGLKLPIALNPDGKVADLFGTSKTTTTVIIDKQGILRYCGRFSVSQHSYAEDALKAVLAGEPVKVKKTRHRG